MKSLTQSELRNQLETAILNDFVIYINQANLYQMHSQYIWDYRYRWFLNAIANNEILPASVELNIHIQSNTRNILNYDWTIISVESENELNIKNMNLKNKQEIVYYIKNYKDLYLLDGKDTKQIMDILLF